MVGSSMSVSRRKHCCRSLRTDDLPVWIEPEDGIILHPFDQNPKSFFTLVKCRLRNSTRGVVALHDPTYGIVD
jgi:hypothetical protein